MVINFLANISQGSTKKKKRFGHKLQNSHSIQTQVAIVQLLDCTMHWIPQCKELLVIFLSYIYPNTLIKFRAFVPLQVRPGLPCPVPEDLSFLCRHSFHSLHFISSCRTRCAFVMVGVKTYTTVELQEHGWAVPSQTFKLSPKHRWHIVLHNTMP